MSACLIIHSDKANIVFRKLKRFSLVKIVKIRKAYAFGNVFRFDHELRLGKNIFLSNLKGHNNP